MGELRERSRYVRTDGRLSRATTSMNNCETIDATLKTLYAVISGPAGQPRDWALYRSLFLPDAHSILAVVKPGDFWEVETDRKIDTFANIAHVLSFYESRREEHDEPFTHGVNSIQLFSDGTRWWIASVMWNTQME